MVQEREPVAIGEPEIEQDHVRWIALADRVRLGQTAGGAHPESGVLQQDARRARDERTVLDDEYVSLVVSHSAFGWLGRVKQKRLPWPRALSTQIVPS